MNKNVLSLILVGTAALSMTAQAGKINMGSRDKIMGYVLIGAGAATAGAIALSPNKGTTANVAGLAETSAEASAAASGLMLAAGFGIAGGAVLIGGVISDLTAKDAAVKEVSAAQFRSLVEVSQNINDKGPKIVDANFELVLGSFECSSCKNETEKSAVLAKTITDMISLSDEIANSGSAMDPALEEKAEERIKALLGTNATSTNISISKRIIGASIALRN